MHVAFATRYDPQDPGRGSGTFYYLSRELERQGHTVDYIGPIEVTPPLASRLMRKWAQRVGRRYRSFQDVLVARQIGARVGGYLEGSQADVLLTNDYAIAGFTSAPCPIALCNDTVFPRRSRDSRHPWVQKVFLPNLWSCRFVNRRGLDRAATWVFPSQWAVDDALAYGIPDAAQRVERIEFGCNLDHLPSSEEARSRTFGRIEERGTLRLLFVGNRDWQLKGGYLAVGVVEDLQSRGINATLDLVGAMPPVPIHDPDIRVHGVIDKATDQQRLLDLYRHCDVLLLPTRAEGFGIAFVEAAAHGMPSLSYDSGTGVNAAVRHGETGLLLPLDCTSADFAETICAWYDEPSRYDSLVQGARSFFDTTANWPTAVARLVRAIETRL